MDKIIYKKEFFEYVEKYHRESTSPIPDDIIFEGLLDDPEVLTTLITHNQQLINKYSDKLRNNKELMEKIFGNLDSTIYHRLSPELKNDKEFMLKLAVVDKRAQYNLGEILENDDKFKETMKNIISQPSLENIVGKEKYELLSHYPDTMKKLENVRFSEKNKIFNACIKSMNLKNLRLSEWTSGLNLLLDRFNSEEYNQLLSSVDVNDIDIDKLNKILSQPNYFNITNTEDIKNYETIKGKVCDSIINENSEVTKNYPKIDKMSDIDKYRFATLQKLYDYDIEDVKKINNQFCGIEDIKAEDKDNLKQYIKSFNTILKLDNTETLKKCYSLQPASKEMRDKLTLVEKFKNYYMQEYNESLFNPEHTTHMSNEDVQKFIPKGIDICNYKFIDAGVDFNMIITSIGAYRENLNTDYASDWNRDITNSHNFSCSYIGNDMLGTAPITNVCYGFNEMSQESLQLSGNQNLGSATNDKELKFTNEYSLYYAPPQYLKDSTSEFNEMVFSRTQNGKRKQPDYLVVLKKGDKVDEDLLKKSMNAVDSFKAQGRELPIVVVDVDRCIESEKNKLDNMMHTAIENSDLDVLKDVEKKIHNNSVANKNEFEEYYSKSSKAWNVIKEKIGQIKDKIQVGIESYKNAYRETNVQERKEEVSDLVGLSIQKTNENKVNTQEVKKITDNER